MLRPKRGILGEDEVVVEEVELEAEVKGGKAIREKYHVLLFITNVLYNNANLSIYSDLPSHRLLCGQDSSST